jgi:sugar/nucleoside kinase (ribokinase family)
MISGVLCCGNLVHDIAVSPISQVVWGRSIWVDSIEDGFGGNGANTSYTLAKLGTPVRLAGMVGSDDAGNRVVAILQAVGVDTSCVERCNLPTPATVALVNPDGARALLHRLGASKEAFKDPIEWTPELTRGCSWFHLANVFALPRLRPRAKEIVAQARENGLSVSIDTGWDARGEWMDVLGPCLPYTDLLFVNEDEARELTGSADPLDAARAFERQGARNVVVKLGAAGCLVCSGEHAVSSPGFRVKVVDTTGAGDCFAGGFLAALQHGFSYVEAAHFANAVGALSVQRFGGTPGLLNFEDTLTWITEQQGG